MISKLHQIGRRVCDRLFKKQGQRMAVYMGDHKAVTRTVWGHKMFVDTRDLSLTPHILLDGYWEMWVTKVFRGIIKEGMTVVEVGANIGYYTLLAAAKVGTGGKVYAFEANPNTFDLLFQSVAVNGFLDRVALTNKGVLAKSGTTKFYTLKRHQAGSSFIAFDAKFREQYREDVEIIEAEVTSLDEYFAGTDVKIDVLKIDAEGSEPLILRGAARVIRGNPQLLIVMEFAPSLISGLGEDPGALLDEIVAYGFKLRYIDPQEGLVEADRTFLLAASTCELFLTRESTPSSLLSHSL